MFFCEDCRVEKDWPESVMIKSKGPCELCHKNRDCHNVPSTALPVDPDVVIEPLRKRWALGFKDRGHGHGDFAVIEESPEGNCPDLGVPAKPVVEVSSKGLAEHLIDLHNKSLEKED